MPTVTMSDGAVVAFDEHGAGAPLVCLHGWSAHGGFFAPQRDALSMHFRVITVDLRGHGRSGGGAAATVERLGADLEELWRALELDGAVLVGWSLGAMAAWAALARPAPIAPAGLVIEDMSPKIVNDAGWSLGLANGHTREAAERAAERMIGDWSVYADIIGPRIFADEPTDDVRPTREWAVNEIRAADPHVMARLWRSMAEQDFRPLLARLELPVLLVWGGLSQLYRPETSAYMAAAAPNADQISFARSGHAPHLEEPALFNQTLRDFAAAVTGPLPAAADGERASQ